MLPLDTVRTTSTTHESAPSYYGNSVLEGKDAQDPQKVASLFEALFYRILLQQMRDSSFQDEILGGREQETVQEMRDNELANYLGAMKQLGIADLMLEQIEETGPASLGLIKS